MRKKIIIGIAGVLFLGALGQIGHSQTDVAGVSTVAVTSSPTLSPTLTPTLTPAIPTIMPTPKRVYVAPTVSQEYQQTTNSSSGLSNDDYYTNSDGNQVHSPAYSNSVPAGASAQCADGTYSFSQSRRGTCSHHGGVATWY